MGKSGGASLLLVILKLLPKTRPMRGTGLRVNTFTGKPIRICRGPRLASHTLTNVLYLQDTALHKRQVTNEDI